MKQAPNTENIRNSLNRVWMRAAFTLVELLVVISIIIILAVLAMPAFTGMKGAGQFASSVWEVQGILDGARAYAMANHTYVYVGFFEEDGSKESTSPATAGAGRVVVAAVARKDGMRGYGLNGALSNPAWKEPNGTGYSGANFTALGGLRRFKNLHLADNMNSVSVTPPTTGNMERPALNNNSYNMGHIACQSITPFSWPLGSTLGGGQYQFNKVIQFNPEGTARMQYATNEDAVVYWMEISLQPVTGTVVPAAPPDQNVGKQAAIMISGMTGVAKTYKP